MDFFNKLSKKASETYQFTKDKTTKISGELKLRNKINECKNKIEDIYEEIGRMVFAQYKSNTMGESEEIKEKCEEIDKLNEEISTAETAILELKEIKKCVSCGAEIKLDVVFCPKCGKEQPKVEKPVEPEVVEEPTEEVVEPEDKENN